MAWVSGRTLAGNASSNPAGGIYVSLLIVVCCHVEAFASELITRPEESYRVWCVWVWPGILENETLAHWGMLHHGKKNEKKIHELKANNFRLQITEQTGTVQAFTGMMVPISHFT